MIPTLTIKQMIEVDRAMIEDFHIQLIQMMENAGLALAKLARNWLGGSVIDKNVIILCGSGNNGGGGLVASRHLHNWGAKVGVILIKPQNELGGLTSHQSEILDRIGIKFLNLDTLPTNQNLIIDSIIGYGLAGSPLGEAAKLILWANSQNAPILALDIPSGLDASIGFAYHPAIQATATLTLALPKKGLLDPEVLKFVGQLYLADIGVPPELYARMGINVPSLFKTDEIIRLA